MGIACSRLMILAAMLFLITVSDRRNAAFCFVQVAQDEQTLTEEEMRQFLLDAKVIRSRQTSTGVTRPYRLTLSDGRLTHDGGFQPIDERSNRKSFDNGRVETNFRDSYHFNIAAYEMAKLLDLQHMMPVTVERKWEGKTGSLTWWLKVKMNEKDRLEKGIRSPDPEAWNRQMYRKRVFANLAGDRDQNATNVLIGENWEIYMIDFSQAFRLRDDIEKRDLDRCDRRLLEKLRALNAADIERAVGHHLTKLEISSVIKRRDKIVAHFEQMVAQKGESNVLY